MKVTLAPTVTEDNDLQEWKAYGPMLRVSSGIVTEVKDGQCEKAPRPIRSKVLGIEMDVTRCPRQELNAPSPIATIGCPNMLSGIETAPPSPT